MTDANSVSVMVVGLACVGKTCMVRQFMSKRLPDEYHPTSFDMDYKPVERKMIQCFLKNTFFSWMGRFTMCKSMTQQPFKSSQPIRTPFIEDADIYGTMAHATMAHRIYEP
eukprot:sb/3477176/